MHPWLLCIRDGQESVAITSIHKWPDGLFPCVNRMFPGRACDLADDALWGQIMARQRGWWPLTSCSVLCVTLAAEKERPPEGQTYGLRNRKGQRQISQVKTGKESQYDAIWTSKYTFITNTCNWPFNCHGLYIIIYSFTSTLTHFIHEKLVLYYPYSILQIVILYLFSYCS